jgi:colanic acid biosynthesis glycosyl transferase WcaI
MKILILNQAFYPDVVSTAQHATDLGLALAGAGHEVTVLSSRRGYDDPSLKFVRREKWKGIQIVRISSTAFGKSARWRRAADFCSFMLDCARHLLGMRRVDVIVSLTSPPLISFIAALAVPLKARRLVLWSMDLNPDEAIAAGWLTRDSTAARLLSRMLVHSLQRADRIIALDRFMKARIQNKKIDDTKISVIPPWSHDDYVQFDPSGRKEFRVAHGLGEKFVVMYSGNHSPCHPLDSLLGAAERLADRPDIAFCFVGGGSEFRKITDRAKIRNLQSIHCIPYQPIEKLSASLSAADLHVVVLGTPFVGIVHPCKIYNILAIGKPFLYIGPEESHIADILHERAQLGSRCQHGDVDGVIAKILAAQNGTETIDFLRAAQRFSKKTLLPEIVRLIESSESCAPSRDAVNGRLAGEGHN